jgi:O-antigen chain-terminating methyltransferase
VHPPRIADLVAGLSEIYQPIRGHPEFDARAKRPCADRLASIERAVAWLGQGRKLRVLDVGCNQGWFSLELAARGHEVVGIDSDPANIALCRALAGEAGLAARFEVATLDELWLARLDDDAFDLALALSVFQHLCHAIGYARAQRIARRLVQRSRALVCELALREEPLYWAQSLPGDPEDLLADCAFVRELARFPTHLSPVMRPVYFASDRVCGVGARGYAIREWSASAHEFERGFHEGTRRYYYCDGDQLVKSVRLTGSHADYNREECAREQAFIRAEGGKLDFVPRDFETEAAGDRHLSVRRLRPGSRLSTLLHRGIAFDCTRVLRDVLAQLRELESRSLYHRDLRTWNVVVGTDGRATLIDFGQIAKEEATDASGLLGVHDAFWSLVHETTHARPNARPVPMLRRDPDALPEPWRSTLVRSLDKKGGTSFAAIEAALARSIASRPAAAAAARRVREAATAELEAYATRLMGLMQ